MYAQLPSDPTQKICPKMNLALVVDKRYRVQMVGNLLRKIGADGDKKGSKNRSVWGSKCRSSRFH